MKRERMPAKICKFVETFLPVDLYSSPTQKILHCGQTGTHVVVRHYIDIENLFSNSYFAESTKDRLAD